MKFLKKNYPYLIILIITILIGFPLLKPKMLDGDDGVFHLFRTFTISSAIKDGQLIPMINPYMMNGLGYAYNMFFGIFPPYIINIINILFNNIGFSVNIFVLLTIFLSGLFMYKFVNHISKNKYTSILSSVIYMSFPYHLFDVYKRMAIGEIASFVFLPLLFWGIYNILNEDGNKWYFVTIGASLLIISHTISAFMSAIFSFLYLLFNIKKLKNKDKIKKLSLSLIFTILLSLLNLLPLLEVKQTDYMIFDTTYMKTNSSNMLNRAINLFDNGVLSNIVKVSIIIVILMIICHIYLKKKNKISESSFFLLAILSLLLTINIIPWNYLPNIFSTIQFPWRNLTFFCFFLSITLPIILDKIVSLNLKKIIIFTIIVLFFAIPFINMGLSNKGIDNELINYNKIKKRGEIARSNGTASAEYLTKNAIYNYEYLKNYKYPHILSNNEEIKTNKKGTHLSFNINLKKKEIIEFPFIYYPGYIVKVNNKSINTFQTKNGLLGIELEKGKYNIKTYYRGSNIMIISYVISFITLVIFIIYIIKQNLYLRKKVKVL